MKYYIFDSGRSYLGTCQTDTELKSGDNVSINDTPFRVIRIENKDFLVVEQIAN